MILTLTPALITFGALWWSYGWLAEQWRHLALDLDAQLLARRLRRSRHVDGHARVAFRLLKGE